MSDVRSIVILALSCMPLHAKICGLTIGVVNQFGVDQAPYRVDAFRSSDESDLKSQFQGLTASRLPCGKYRYVLARVDQDNVATRISGEVSIEGAGQWLTVNPNPNILGGPGVVIARDGFAPADLIGRLQPVPKGRPVVIRLIELYGSRLFEALAAEDGMFVFPRAFSGSYLVVVLQQGKVLGTELLKVEDSRFPRVVDIKIGSPLLFRQVK